MSILRNFEFWWDETFTLDLSKILKQERSLQSLLKTHGKTPSVRAFLNSCGLPGRGMTILLKISD